MGCADASAPFAEVGDIEAAWRPLAEDERSRAAKLLGYAEARIRALLPAGWERDPGILGNLEAVCVCSVVRQLSAASPIGGDAALSQFSQTAGSYSVQGTLANPNADWYLTAQEKELLGIGAGWVGTVPMGGYE